MKFIQIINQKRFTLITIFLFLYVLLNLLDGERGLISYYEKQNNLFNKINSIEKMNSLLTNKIDLDYLEILYREKFMVGKSNEYIYKSN